MVVDPLLAYGILFALGLLVLGGFVIIFARLGRAAGLSKEPRTLAPIAWPISAQKSTATPSATDEPPAADADAHRRRTYR